MKKVLFSWPIILLILVSCGYYWKVFAGRVPFPGDLLVGAYLPWLEYKWDNVVGVAIKNALISDIFSQIFLWKNEISRNLSSGEWPLWNPYSYSGYPLLANFQSGSLNPFNLLMVIFGPINGWTLLVMTQTFGSLLAMYYYLRVSNRQKMASVIASVVYSFGGSAIIWSQYVNAGFAMIYLPLILATIELATSKSDRRYLLLLSPLLVLLVFAGHLQSLVFATVITILYYAYRIGFGDWFGNRIFIVSGLIAIGLSAIQLLPTVELMNLSVRFHDSFAKSVNFGLLPGRNIITMIAPDFFGNPTTGNYWGFYDYQETILYNGILGLTALIFGIFNFKKLKQGKFFLVLAVIAYLLQFDNSLGRAIYFFKIPFLWTSVAGRISTIHLLGVAVIVAEFIELIPKLTFRNKTKIFIPMFFAIVITATISYFSIRLFNSLSFRNELLKTIGNLGVGIRNLLIPSGLVTGFYFLIIFSEKIRFWRILVLTFTIIDLFKFGWKYTPFVPKLYVYPETEITTFLEKDKDVFRIEKELGEIMPQNTWTAYQLMSPSGYDPMALEDYTKDFSRDLNHVEYPGVTRFSEINTYDAEALGKYNVKYLLAIKRDREARLGGDFYNSQINLGDWNVVFNTKMVAILENLKYQKRARVIFDNGGIASGSAEIISYTNNKIVIEFKNINGSKLLLADTFYPGWKAMINGIPIEISNKYKPFRSIDISNHKNGTVIFEYKPDSFERGKWISLVSLLVWLFLIYRSFHKSKI